MFCRGCSNVQVLPAARYLLSAVACGPAEPVGITAQRVRARPLVRLAENSIKVCEAGYRGALFAIKYQL